MFCYFFSSGLIQEWSKSICLTFVHNIWPVVYSTKQLITKATSAHVFPFTTRSEGTHHPACYYPAPSTTMSPFSVGCIRGKNGLLSLNAMRCGQTRSIVCVCVCVCVCACVRVCWGFSKRTNRMNVGIMHIRAAKVTHDLFEICAD